MTEICRWSHHCSTLYFYPSLSLCLSPPSHFSTQSLSFHLPIFLPGSYLSICLISPSANSLSNPLLVSLPLASPSLHVLSVSLLPISLSLPLHTFLSILSPLSYYRLISRKCSFPLKHNHRGMQASSAGMADKGVWGLQTVLSEILKCSP